MMNKVLPYNRELGLTSRIGAFCVLAGMIAGCFVYAPVSAQDKPNIDELVLKCWEAHGKKDIEKTFEVTQQLIDAYREDALAQQASLKELPKGKDEIDKVAALNYVATAYFIQGESYRDQGKNDEAFSAFKMVVDSFCCAQAWDQRGWYWQIAKASQESIAKLKPEEGKDLKNCKCVAAPTNKKVNKCLDVSPTKLILNDLGKEKLAVNYSKYGVFKNVGTKDYRYDVKDQEGLSQAVGEGIFPNTTSVRWDPAFKQTLKAKRLDCGDHWDFVHSPDKEAAFFKWATSSEPQGVKLFYTGLILEEAGYIEQAIKCYYAIVVHFPGSYGWTYFKTPWYVGQAAISKINFLLRRNPKLGYRLVGADIKIENGFDNDVSNDVVSTNPGKFEKVKLMEKLKSKFPQAVGKVKTTRGSGSVYLAQYENGDWQLMVSGKPFIIKAITYTPTKVGQSPDNGTMGNWMEEDFNNNGKIDGPFDAFVDKNQNNIQDPDEPSVGDFALMRDMGVNAIRLYHHPNKVNKELLRQLYEQYGIRVIMGDFLGKYTHGSGASWNPGTDYENELHKKNMIESVTAMVNEYKDEPYILFWLLGNENVYGYACNADKKPDAFYAFANEAAKIMKQLDPNHPVAICNGDVLYLDKFAANAPDIDIFGANAYRGSYGFSFFWKQVRSVAGRPAFITEFGCPSYAFKKSQDEAEVLQADYHRGSWEDIAQNMAFAGGAGNALGGIVFEWLDEWWKGYEPSVHDTKGLWVGPFPDGTMYEEWLGIADQGDGTQSPFLRHLRKSYYTYKELWK